jgi:hypothetical protein
MFFLMVYCWQSPQTSKVRFRSFDARVDSSKIAPQKYLYVAFEHWYRDPKQDTCGNGVGLAQ